MSGAPSVTPGGATPEPELPAAAGPALLGQGALCGLSVPLSTGCGPRGVAVWGVDEKAEAHGLGLEETGQRDSSEAGKQQGPSFLDAGRGCSIHCCVRHTPPPAHPTPPQHSPSEDANGFFLEASPTLHGHVLALCMGQSGNGN